MSEANRICGILVTLHVADTQVLYVMLSVDSTIHRMGTGSESNTELDLFIGHSSRDVFDDLCKEITPNLLQWVGVYADPHLQGKRCRLTIGLRQVNGKELVSRWEYGTNSQSPPPEVCDFVLAAINITDPWYEQQKQLAKREGDQRSRES